MSASTEHVIYRTPEIVITSVRCTFGSKTYPTDEIRSVRMGAASYVPGSVLGGGIVLLAVLGPTLNHGWILAAPLLVLAIAIFAATRLGTTYYVQLHTNGGYVRAFTSRDVAAVQRVVESIDLAIAVRLGS